MKDFAGQLSADARSGRPLPTIPAAFWISLFSFKEMVRRRRLIALGLVMLLPVLITLLWRSLDTEGLISPSLWMANLGGIFYVHFLVALVSLAVGLSAISEQVDEGTIVYYWTRPIERNAIYLGRLFAAQMVGMVFLVCSLAICFVVMTAGNSGALTFKFLELYFGNVVIIGVGALVYTSIFAAVGAWLKKPMLISVLWAFGWESVGTSPAPQRIKELTVVFHLRNLIQNTASGTESFPNLLEELKAVLMREEPVPEWESALALAATIVVSTLIGMWLLRRKEIFR